MSDAGWTLNGGEVGHAIEIIAAAQRAGALLRIEVERESLQKARADGLLREQEGGLLRIAWDTVVATIPPAAVGRRALWSTFEFVLEGDELALGALGLGAVKALESIQELPPWCWHVIFTEVFTDEPVRTLLCDPGYDLGTAKGRTAIAWAKPYAGDDWRQPRRYPTVKFLTVDG